MADNKVDMGSVSYVLGILSIVLAFPFLGNSFSGLVLGIIGYSQGKKHGNEKAKKLNKIGIALSIIFIIINIALIYTLGSYCTNNPGAGFCKGLFPA